MYCIFSFMFKGFIGCKKSKWVTIIRRVSSTRDSTIGSCQCFRNIKYSLPQFVTLEKLVSSKFVLYSHLFSNIFSNFDSYDVQPLFCFTLPFDFFFFAFLWYSFGVFLIYSSLFSNFLISSLFICVFSYSIFFLLFFTLVSSYALFISPSSSIFLS